MKILALSAQIPYPPHHGKAMRDYHLLTGLARRHSVRLLCMVRDPAEVAAAAPLAGQVPFSTVPLPAHTIPRRMAALLLSRRPDLVWRTGSRCFWGLLLEELRATPPDLVLVEGLEMAAYGLWAGRGAWGRLFGRGWQRTFGAPAPLVLDEHNAEYLLQRRAGEVGRTGLRGRLAALYSQVQAGRLARFEASACAQADQVIAVSPADRQALLAIAPQARVAVVPNGVDTAEYAPLPPLAEPYPPTLVFTGRMDFRPNVDAVQWFCAEVWPRIRAQVPQTRFRIVGRDPTPAVCALGEVPGVEVVGAVPDDRPYIGRADLYVLPMRFGGGIRFKLLQALSMARAVVSTPPGAEGVEGLVDGQHLALAETAGSFAARTLDLLGRPDERARLGQAGRELVVAGYDWNVLLPRLEAVFAALLSR
jgi:glycosyltransferase involved in cell wall biosynthesis